MNQDENNTSGSKENTDDPLPIQNYDTNDLKKFEEEAEKERTDKPGSQSNTTGQHNSARGSK